MTTLGETMTSNSQKRCTDCNLSSKCTNPLIWGRGSHKKNTKYMVIQDAPGFLEDKWDKILVGDVQAKLNYFFEKAGIDYREVYFTSAVKCDPKKNSKIKNTHLEECSKYLFQEIIEHKPKVIITMGRWAWQAVSGKTSVKEFAGHFDDFELDYNVEVNGADVDRTFNAKLMPTYSLYASLKKWEYNTDIIRHFEKAKKYVQTDKIDTTKPPKLNVILTIEQLNEWVKRMSEYNGPCATDFETTGFEFHKDQLINAGYCSQEGHADIIYFNRYKKEHSEKWDLVNKKRAKQINTFLKNHKQEILDAVRTVHAMKNIKFVLHNGKFDSKFAAKNKIPYRNFYFDTLLASPLIDENLPHSLNFCLERNGLNYGAYDTKLWEYTNKDEKNKKSYQYIPPLLIEKYLGIDVDGCFRLFKKQVVQLKQEGMTKHFHDLKMPSLRNITKMEYIGVKADRKLINKSSRIIQKKQALLNDQIVKITQNEKFNPNSADQVANFLVENGYPMQRLKIKITDGGKYSTATTELEKFTKYEKWKEFPQLILNSKKLAKIRGTYIDGKNGAGGMLQYLDENDRIHTNFNLWTPRTSRYSCFAKGTPIEVIRDLKKYPKGVPIEKVQIGDLAYTYDKDNNLTLRRVISTFKNKPKQLYRLHWASSSGRVGYVDTTCDHYFNTYDRGFVRADDLRSGEKLNFLSRKNVWSKGYSALMYRGEPNGITEHRFVFKDKNGSFKDGHDVHHLDENHLNNHPDNLIEMTKEHHRSHHAKVWANTAEKRALSSKTLKDRWAKGLVDLPKGELHPEYKGWSKLKILKIIMACGCRTKYSGYDYYTIRKYLDLHAIDYSALKDRFTHTGAFIPSWKIKKCIAENYTIEGVKDFLKIGQSKWYRLKKQHVYESNHKFVCLEKLDGRIEEVYDLEIEETHNYIAGEINAHNCNRPSLQVWPRPIKGLPNTRNFIRPTNKNWGLFEADYSQLEQCVVAALSKDKVLIKRIQAGMDLHCINAADLGKSLKSIPSWVRYEHMMIANDKTKDLIDVDEKQVQEFLKDIEKHGGEINWKEKRTQAKGIGFGLNYGKGAISFADEFKISLDDAQEMIDAYFGIYSGMYDWRESIVNNALTKGEIYLQSGRKRRFHAAIDWLKSEHAESVWSSKILREEISRQAMNSPVQGGAHEVFEPACLRLLNRFKAEGMQARLLLSIHDGIVGESPLEEREMVKKCILEEMPTIFHKGTPLELKLKVDVDFYKWEWYGEKIKLSA